MIQIPGFDILRYLDKTYPSYKENYRGYSNVDKELAIAIAGSPNLTYELFVHLLNHHPIGIYFSSHDCILNLVGNNLRRNPQMARMIIKRNYRKYKTKKILKAISALKNKLPDDLVPEVIKYL